MNKAISGQFKKYPFTFIGIIVVGLINSTTTFLLPVSIGDFFALYFHTKGSKGKLLAWMGLDFKTLSAFFLFFTLLLLVKTITEYCEKWWSYKQGELFVKNIRESVFEAQINWENNFFISKPYGSYLLRYSNDLSAIQNYMVHGILGGIKNVLFLLIGLIILAKIHFNVTIFLCIFFLLTGTVIYFVAKYQKQFILQSRGKRSGLLAYVTKMFSRHRRIKEKQAELKAIENFNKRSQNLYDANLKVKRIESFTQSLIPLLQFGVIGFLLWLIAHSSFFISATEGLMMMLIILQIQSSLRQILKVPGILNRGKISLEKVLMLMKERNPPLPSDPVLPVV